MFFNDIYQNRSVRLAFVRRIRHIHRVRRVFAADALIGRFLPRLGPLVVTRAASFLLGANFHFSIILQPAVCQEHCAASAGSDQQSPRPYLF